MLYRLGRPIVRFVTKEFYSSFKIRGHAPIEAGPLLVLCNHPNFMLDAFIVNRVFERGLWYLAKSTIFSGAALSWFLRSAHLIPVYRKQDNPDDLSKNKDTFLKAVEHLHRQGAIVIFPEGVSRAERKLAPLKTGAARIALQAEEAQGFELGLRIQPVGLTYTDFDRFKSSVTVVLGEPLEVKVFRDAYLSDPVEAVRELTSLVEDRLRAVTVEVTDADHGMLVENISKVYASVGRDSDDHERMQTIIENVNELRQQLSEEDYHNKSAHIGGKIEEFLSLIEYSHLGGHESLEKGYDWLFSLLAFPFVLLGVLLHWIPYRLIDWGVARVTSYVVEAASKKLTLGVVIYPLWYFVITSAVLLYVESLAVAGLALLLCLASGYCVSNYFHQVRLLVLSWFWRGRGNPLEKARAMRDELIQELEALRVH